MRVLAIALAGLSIAAVLPAGANAAPPSYPIICRPNSDMRVVYLEQKGYMRMQFKRGTTPAKPGPGECVWLDRAFGQKEPNFLVVPGKHMAMTRYFLDAFLNGQTFYAHVYNDPADSGMLVTRAGP